MLDFWPHTCGSCLFRRGLGVGVSLKMKRTEIYEPVHEISNNVVCATSTASDHPAHKCNLIGAFASRLSIL